MARAVTEQEKQMAQQYAQRALEGKGPGGYVPTSLMANALINANLPITQDEPSKSVNASPPVSTGPSAAEIMMNRYLEELERQRAERQAALNAQYNRGKQSINENAAAGNKDAYVSYMLGMKNMPQKSVMYGSGGMAQSLAQKGQLNYENTRAGIQKAKNESLADLEADYRAGILDAGNDYLTKLTAAQDKISALNKPVSSSVTTGGTGGSGYKIGNTGIKADNELSLYNQLIALGFTREQAEDYMLRQGVITK